MANTFPSLFELSARRLARSAITDLSIKLEQLRFALGRHLVRVYIPKSVNYGHQSNSIQIVRRLIELGAQHIEIGYNDAPDDNGVSNSQKLLKLVPEASKGAIERGGAADIAGVQVTFTKEQFRRFDRREPVWLAISGGDDDAAIADLTALNAHSYLCLQPFAYQKHHLDNAQNLFITSDASGFNVRFSEYVYKPFYCGDPGATPRAIEALTREFQLLGRKGYLLQELLRLADGGNIALCPIYFSIGRVMSWFYWIYLGLLLGLLPHQSASLSPKPIVLLSFMPLANSSSETHAQGLGWLKEFVSGNKSLWTQLGKHSQLFPNAEAIHQTLNKKRAERPSRFQELRDRVRFFNAEDSKDVERCLEKLKAPSATKIYVIAAERVANPIFWRFFAAAELPCIFEGEGTAAPLCNLGKPFLHLYSQEWAGENSEGVDQLYPDPQLQPVIKNRRGGSELSQLREVCSQVVWSLTPERGYEEDSEGELCVEKRVFGFLQEVTTSGTHLNQYFRALRNTFHDQAEDKVLDGLLRWLRWGEETKKFT